MIRLATEKDIDQAEQIYEAVLDFQAEHVNYTNWAKGLYPTRATAEKAVEAGTLYVGEAADGTLYGVVNLNHVQPVEYDKIPWQIQAEGEEVLVIHTLCIPPQAAGNGYGREFVAFAEELARKKGCTTIRLDTFEENKPAETLYSNLGYKLVGKTLFHFENVIWETLICMDKVL